MYAETLEDKSSPKPKIDLTDVEQLPETTKSSLKVYRPIAKLSDHAFIKH
jgi:ribonuclease I